MRPSPDREAAEDQDGEREDDRRCQQEEGLGAVHG
jgi:hypothetical protein